MSGRDIANIQAKASGVDNQTYAMIIDKQAADIDQIRHEIKNIKIGHTVISVFLILNFIILISVQLNKYLQTTKKTKRKNNVDNYERKYRDLEKKIDFMLSDTNNNILDIEKRINAISSTQIDRRFNDLESSIRELKSYNSTREQKERKSNTFEKPKQPIDTGNNHKMAKSYVDILIEDYNTAQFGTPSDRDDFKNKYTILSFGIPENKKILRSISEIDNHDFTYFEETQEGSFFAVRCDENNSINLYIMPAFNAIKYADEKTRSEIGFYQLFNAPPKGSDYYLLAPALFKVFRGEINYRDVKRGSMSLR